MAQGGYQQLKTKSVSFENNVLDDSTDSKYNQIFMNDTGQPSAHHKTMTYLVISVCQILEHYTQAQRKLEALQ